MCKREGLNFRLSLHVWINDLASDLMEQYPIIAYFAVLCEHPWEIWCPQKEVHRVSFAKIKTKGRRKNICRNYCSGSQWDVMLCLTVLNISALSWHRTLKQSKPQSPITLRKWKLTILILSHCSKSQVTDFYHGREAGCWYHWSQTCCWVPGNFLKFYILLHDHNHNEILLGNAKKWKCL